MVPILPSRILFQTRCVPEHSYPLRRRRGEEAGHIEVFSFPLWPLPFLILRELLSLGSWAPDFLSQVAQATPRLLFPVPLSTPVGQRIVLVFPAGELVRGRGTLPFPLLLLPLSSGLGALFSRCRAPLQDVSERRLFLRWVFQYSGLLVLREFPPWFSPLSSFKPHRFLLFSSLLLGVPSSGLWLGLSLLEKFLGSSPLG